MTIQRYHSTEIHERAYEIWCLRAGRSPSETARILAEEHGWQINRQTIHDWSKRHAWADRYMDDLERAFPYARKETAANLVNAGVLASRKLLAHLNGEKLERGEEKVIFGALDRAGFSPIGSRDPLGATVPQVVQRSSIVEKLLSAEEIAEIASEDSYG